MKIMGPEKTRRLWDRLERESFQYYRMLHDAKNQRMNIGPKRFDDLSAVFSDLQRQYKRLKSRFIVMVIIGQTHRVDGRRLSDLTHELGDWIIGPGGVQEALDQVSVQWSIERLVSNNV